MSRQLKLTKENITELERRLEDAGVKDEDERMLIKALLRMAKTHPAPAPQRTMAWAFSWQND